MLKIAKFFSSEMLKIAKSFWHFCKKTQLRPLHAIIPVGERCKGKRFHVKYLKTNNV